MHLFYVEELSSDFCTLSQEASKHCVRVLRLTTGAEVWLTDGQGQRCRAEIVDADVRSCTVRIVERDEAEPRPYALHLVVAPTKNPARMEWLVEKATELGLDRLSPVVCDHSERVALKCDRLQRLAVGAMQQSLSCRLPLIDPLQSLDDVLAAPFDGQRFVAHCEKELRHPLLSVCRKGCATQILIGPEGDFSPREIALALDRGFVPVSLGASRLRTETAALYAAAALNLINA